MFDKHPTLVPGRQRLSIFVGLVLLCLTLTRFIELPTRTWSVSVFGSPLGVELSSEWLMATLVAGLICTGTDALIRTHPRARQVSLSSTFVYWVQPASLGLIAAHLLTVAPTRLLWVAGLAVTGLLLVGMLIAEYTTVDPLAPAYSRARLLLNVTAYALAFVTFVIVYQTRSRSLVLATLMFTISFVLALDLLWSASAARGIGHVAALAAAVGLIIGECSWALNYSRLSVWSGGTCLLLVFYTLTGIAAQHLQGQLKAHVLFEFGIVAAVGIIVLIVFHP